MKTMPSQNDTNDASTEAADTTNLSQFPAWERLLWIVVIVAALVELLVGAGLLIQAYISHKSELKLLGYNFAALMMTAGCLAVIIAPNTFISVGNKRKRLSYVWEFIGPLSLFISAWISFIAPKPGQKWWAYFDGVTLATGSTTIIISTLVGTERRRFRGILLFITTLLMLATSVLIFLEARSK